MIIPEPQTSMETKIEVIEKVGVNAVFFDTRP